MALAEWYVARDPPAAERRNASGGALSRAGPSGEAGGSSNSETVGQRYEAVLRAMARHDGGYGGLTFEGEEGSAGAIHVGRAASPYEAEADVTARVEHPLRRPHVARWEQRHWTPCYAPPTAAPASAAPASSRFALYSHGLDSEEEEEEEEGGWEQAARHGAAAAAAAALLGAAPPPPAPPPPLPASCFAMGGCGSRSGRDVGSRGADGGGSAMASGATELRAWPHARPAPSPARGASRGQQTKPWAAPSRPVSVPAAGATPVKGTSARRLSGSPSNSCHNLGRDVRFGFEHGGYDEHGHGERGRVESVLAMPFTSR